VGGVFFIMNIALTGCIFPKGGSPSAFIYYEKLNLLFTISIAVIPKDHISVFLL